MGTWGNYPTDNDGALDLQGIINEKIKSTLPRIWNHQYFSDYEKAGCIMLMLQKRFFVPRKYVVLASEAIASKIKEVSANDQTESSIKFIEENKIVLEAFRELITDINNVDAKELLAPKNWLQRANENVVNQ